jgi:ribosomal protein L7/L12
MKKFTTSDYYKEAIRIIASESSDFFKIACYIAETNPSVLVRANKFVSGHTYKLVLVSCGEKKISCIKAIRAVSKLGLKDAKDLADTCPKDIVGGLSYMDANKAAQGFLEIGASIDIVQE